MGFRTRRAVRRLALEVGAEAQECRCSGPNGFERLEASFDYRGYRVRIGAGRRVSIDLRGFESSVAFALGNRELINGLIAPRDPPPALAKVPLFACALLPSSTASWLADEGNARAVAALGGSRREPLFVWYGMIHVIVRPERATTETLAGVADVVKRLEASPPLPTSGRVVDGLRLDPDLLPPDLLPLVPLIEAWAVGDDVRRQQMLQAATPEERGRLVKTVGPLLDRIDAYLDSFAPDQVPEEAALVGRLAEAVAELGVPKPPGD